MCLLHFPSPKSHPLPLTHKIYTALGRRPHPSSLFSGDSDSPGGYSTPPLLVSRPNRRGGHSSQQLQLSQSVDTDKIQHRPSLPPPLNLLRSQRPPRSRPLPGHCLCQPSQPSKTSVLELEAPGGSVAALTWSRLPGNDDDGDDLPSLGLGRPRVSLPQQR